MVLFATDVHAGPWTREWGQYYVKLSEGFFLSDSFIDSTGALRKGTDYLGATTSIYAEVGLFYGFQVQAYLPYMIARNTFAKDGAGFIQGGGAEAIFGLQYTPPLDLGFPYAFRVDAKIPLGQGTTDPRFPALGDGQVDLTFWLSAGGSIVPLPLYLYAEVGYRHRAEAAYKDGVALFSQIGYTFFDRLLVALNTSGVLAFTNESPTKSYITLGPWIYLPVYKALALEASFDPVIYAKNSSRGFSFTFGASYKN